MKTKYCIYLINMFIIALYCSCSNQQDQTTIQTAVTKDSLNHFNKPDLIKLSSNFYDAFHKRHEFLIDTSIKIGFINSFDVNERGDILLTDPQGQQSFIIDSTGKLKMLLTPEPCDPGFHWSPIKASYINNKIYIINSGPWGYKFDKNGNCIGKMSKTFLPPYILVGLNQNTLVGYYTTEGDLTLQLLDTEGNKHSSFGIFPSEYKNFITRIEGGGLIVDKDQNIYQMNISSPKIYKYDNRGKLLTIFKNYPAKFNRLRKDLSNDIPEMMKQAQEALETISLAQSLFLLNEETLIMKIREPKGYKILVLHRNFDLMHDQPYELTKNLVYAKNNYLYFLEDELQKNGNYLNPKITIYQKKSL